MPAIQSFSKPVVTILFLVVIGAVAGCDSSSSPGSDGDVDSPDITAETGDEAPGLDGDVTEEADADLDEGEAAEPEGEEEEESETLEESAYTTYSLLDTAELVSCDALVTAERDEFYWAVSVHRATDGALYFGNRYGLWRLDEHSAPQRLVCVPGIAETVWSIASRHVDDTHELWVGLDGRVGVLRGNVWDFIDVPAVWKHEGAHFNGPESGCVWKVAVNDGHEVIQTTQGVAFRQGAGGFTVIDWCEEGALTLPAEDLTDNWKTVTSSQWASPLLAGSTVTVGGKQAIFKLDLAAQTCSPHCTTELDGHYFVVSGQGDQGLWAMHALPGSNIVNRMPGGMGPPDYVPTEPYTRELELGLCDWQNQWYDRYQAPPSWTISVGDGTAAIPGRMATGWTLVTDLVRDGGMIAAFMAAPWETITMLVDLDGQNEPESEELLLDRVSTTTEGWWYISPPDWGLGTGIWYVVPYSIQWSAAFIPDGDGYWYSPGFTRIEKTK